MNKKHIIILHTDQQRYDSLGCNGNSVAHTPNLDSLAADGSNFSRHIVANPVCMPSRASFLTGNYPPGHGVKNNGIPLWRAGTKHAKSSDHANIEKQLNITAREYIPTMADYLQSQGYYTSLRGKLHLEPHLAPKEYGFYESYDSWNTPEIEQEQGQYYGFESAKIILGHGEAPCGYNRGHYGRWLEKHHPEVAQQVFSGADANTMASSERGDIYRSKLPSKLHNTMWLAEEACQEIVSATKREKPTFLFVGFPDPHHPFTPPEDMIESFLDVPYPDCAKLRQAKGCRSSDKPEAVRESIATHQASRADIELAYKYTLASVALIDRAVGEIVATLKNEGLYDDTLIVFTSDHGDFLGDFDMLAKDNIAFMPLVHVPFVLKPPKGCGLPSIVDTPMSNVDVLPTIFGLLGLPIPEEVQGCNIFAETATNASPMVCCYGHHEALKNFSIIDERYRYTFFPMTGEEEFYDHQQDPKEECNLAANPLANITNIMAEKRQKTLERLMRYDKGIYHMYALW